MFRSPGARSAALLLTAVLSASLAGAAAPPPPVNGIGGDGSSMLSSAGTDADTAAPVVESVTATPSTLDLSSGSREITVRAHITDDTGSQDPYVHARARDYRVVLEPDYMELSSGTLKDGWWKGTATLPPDAPNGTWILQVTAPRDLNSNSWGDHSVTEATVNVTGSSRTDYSAPAVQDASVSPAAGDQMNGLGTFTVTADITDAAGVRDGAVFYSSEDHGTQDPFSFYASMTLVAGTVEDGTWSGQFTVPEGAPAGRYAIDFDTTDNLGNWDTTSLEPVVMTNGVAPAIAFKDVVEGSWFFAPVNWMVEREITTGYADGTFKPYKPVTRGEVVTFLYRYADEDFTAPKNIDLKDVPPTHNFFEAISWATSNGVVNGYKDGAFRSSKNMTRAEVAAVLYRQAKPEHVSPAESPFEDLTPESNQYEAIAWLAQQEITTGRSDGTFDPGANVTRAEIAAFLDRYNTVLPQ